MPPAIIASPRLVTPSRAYCTALTSSSPRPSPSLAPVCPRRKNSHQNDLSCEFSYLTDLSRFGLVGRYVLIRHGVETSVVDSASLEVNRRYRRAKTDRLDGPQGLHMAAPASAGGEERHSG